jgi:hypothetical protein
MLEGNRRLNRARVVGEGDPMVLAQRRDRDHLALLKSQTSDDRI